MKNIFLLLFICISFIKVFPQNVAIGEWEELIPYHKGIAVAKSATQVFEASKNGILIYNDNDNSIDRLSKVQGLSDININTIAYHNGTKSLIIGYENGNIDILKNNVIINIADLKRKNIFGDKSINRIRFEGTTVYLATGFGVILLDLSNQEIKGTYFIDEFSNTFVNDLTINDSAIFVATSTGVFYGDKTVNLSDFRNWNHITNIPNANSNFNAIEIFNNKITVNYSSPSFNTDTIYQGNNNGWTRVDSILSQTNNSLEVNNDKLVVTHFDNVDVFNTDFSNDRHVFTYQGSLDVRPAHAIFKNNVLWIADKGNGLIKNTGTFSSEVINVEGPNTLSVRSISIQNEKITIATGGVTSRNIMDNRFLVEGFFVLENNKWKTFDRTQTEGLDITMFDFMKVVVDPTDETVMYVAMLGTGVLKFKNNKLDTIYNSINSRITDLAFDNNNNLWLTHSDVSSSLSVKTAADNWITYDFSSLYSGRPTDQLLIDQLGQKWVVLTNGVGLLVFNDNGTLNDKTDDQQKILNGAAGNGNLASSTVLSLAEDQDGKIWVGTDKGINVFFSPGAVFQNTNFDSQQIIIEIDGFPQNLLETESVSAIAIDGANRKWCGTESSGVFLISADGTKQLAHFTVDNSPLFSNTINSIAIKDDGQVFIGTSKGILSYRGGATKGNFNFSNVLAFPNPVLPNYSGSIAIKGLTTNAEIKITDVAGNLVYAGNSFGGQAIWNGKNFNNERVAPGVYLVFSIAQDGTKTKATKILVI